MIKKARRYLSLVSMALAAIAVIDQMRKPESERDWHGVLFGLVPYDFRPITFGRLKERMWNPDDPRLFTPQAFGVGWTLNLARAYQLINEAREPAAEE
ncbi:MAG TPA: DUF5808 domain-containing protein [Dehalococcoidia bacterium]|nr:DUF5808 domain-containing protein [Dehalococcoidia bacterium]